MNELLSAILGAIIGGLATYFANYYLEKKKRGAKAALLRKEEVYSPIYDELVLMEQNLETQQTSFKPIQQGPLFLKWPSLRNSSSALTMPNQLRKFLDSFTPICNDYIPKLNDLYQQIRGAIPDNLSSQGILNNQIVSRLAEIMMVVPNIDYNLFKRQIEIENPGLDELYQYWTKDRFEQARNTIIRLSAWSNVKEIYNSYKNKLTEVKEELFQHIRSIVQEYERPDSR